MTPDQLTADIAIAQALVQLGLDVGGKIKALFAIIHPGTAYTDAEIDAIEQAIVTDAQARAAERAAMGQPTE